MVLKAKVILLIDVGKMNKRITFMRKEPIKDEMGQDSFEWKEYKKIWATIKPYKSSEAQFMSKLRPEVTHRAYIRFRKDITVDMRVMYNNRLFEISGPPIDMDEAHVMLEIQLQEVFDGEEYRF